jgi:hypothetical protein
VQSSSTKKKAYTEVKKYVSLLVMVMIIELKELQANITMRKISD